MIVSNELRIGNWLNVHGRPCQVTYLNNEVFGNKDEQKFAFNEAQPIAITRELLLQTGFEKDLYGFKSRQIALNQYEDVYYLRLPQGTGFGRGIRYVHQLQNLYFEISGQEYILSASHFNNAFSLAG